MSDKVAAEAAARRALENVASDEVTVIRIVGKRWEKGSLLFEMSGALQGRWLDVFKSYGQTSICYDGFYLDPQRFSYSGSILTVLNEPRFKCSSDFFFGKKYSFELGFPFSAKKSRGVL